MVRLLCLGRWLWSTAPCSVLTAIVDPTDLCILTYSRQLQNASSSKAVVARLLDGLSVAVDRSDCNTRHRFTQKSIFDSIEIVGSVGSEYALQPIRIYRIHQRPCVLAAPVQMEIAYRPQLLRFSFPIELSNIVSEKGFPRWSFPLDLGRGSRWPHVVLESSKSRASLPRVLPRSSGNDSWCRRAFPLKLRGLCRIAREACSCWNGHFHKSVCSDCELTTKGIALGKARDRVWEHSQARLHSWAWQAASIVP